MSRQVEGVVTLRQVTNFVIRTNFGESLGKSLKSFKLEMTMMNGPYSYPWYWTGTNFSTANDDDLFLMIFLRMNHHYKLVPVQNRVKLG